VPIDPHLPVRPLPIEVLPPPPESVKSHLEHTLSQAKAELRESQTRVLELQRLIATKQPFEGVRYRSNDEHAAQKMRYI
jgi:hypothetical protein